LFIASVVLIILQTQNHATQYASGALNILVTLPTLVVLYKQEFYAYCWKLPSQRLLFIYCSNYNKSSSDKNKNSDSFNDSTARTATTMCMFLLCH